MIKRDHQLYLSDIRETAVKILQFCENLTYEEFSIDEKTQFAVIRGLEIIGEASKKIPKHIQDTYSSLAWKEMAGMRDVLIHDYFGIDIEVVWKTVKQELPKIIQMIN